MSAPRSNADRRRLPALLAATLLSLTGCGDGGFDGLNDMPLPGGVDVGDGMQVTVEMDDVLNLARQSSVKMDDVTVGRVDSITRDGWHAEVVLTVRDDLDLPANTVAVVRQTGLLGEKYVELSPPLDVRARGTLTSGARIGLDRTGRSFEVEEVLGALSVLLNGGGIDRIRTITSELHEALDGREDTFRDLLGRLNSFTGTFARNRPAIEKAIDGLDELAVRAARGSATITRTLDNLGPAIEVLADQRKDLVGLLRASTRLSRVGTRVVTRVSGDLLANLEALDPILTRLGVVAKDLPQAVPFLMTFPIPDVAMQAFKGDYVNFDARLDLDLGALLSGLGTDPPAFPPPNESRTPRAAPAGPDGSRDQDTPLANDPLGLLGLIGLLGGSTSQKD